MRTSKKCCASSNKLRTFGRASALHPVPLARKVVQELASASTRCSRKIFIHRGPVDPGAASTEPFRLHAGRARRKKIREIRGLVFFLTEQDTAQKKGPCLRFGTAPLKRD
jgi:hypothetical protein